MTTYLRSFVIFIVCFHLTECYVPPTVQVFGVKSLSLHPRTFGRKSSLFYKNMELEETIQASHKKGSNEIFFYPSHLQPDLQELPTVKVGSRTVSFPKCQFSMLSWRCGALNVVIWNHAPTCFGSSPPHLVLFASNVKKWQGSCLVRPAKWGQIFFLTIFSFFVFSPVADQREAWHPDGHGDALRADSNGQCSSFLVDRTFHWQDIIWAVRVRAWYIEVAILKGGALGSGRGARLRKIAFVLPVSYSFLSKTHKVHVCFIKKILLFLRYDRKVSLCYPPSRTHIIH